MTGFGGTGDATRGAQDNDINSNCIVGNQTAGVRYDVQYLGTQATNMVNGNNIQGNVTGASYADGGADALDAEDNWWGASDGPSGDGPGSGDPVVNPATGGGTIDFNPFETAPLNLACNATIVLCDGFEPPLDDPSVAVSVKKNRVLPFRAVLTDLSGNILTAADLPNPPKIQVTFDPVGSMTDVTADALPAGKGSDGDEFEFNGSKWGYNLSTKQYTEEGSYKVSMVLPAGLVLAPSCMGTFEIQ